MLELLRVDAWRSLAFTAWPEGHASSAMIHAAFGRVSVKSEQHDRNGVHCYLLCAETEVRQVFCSVKKTIEVRYAHGTGLRKPRISTHGFFVC